MMIRLMARGLEDMVVPENSNIYFSVDSKLLTSEGYITYNNLLRSPLYNLVLISVATRDSRFKSCLHGFKEVYAIELKKVNSKTSRSIYVSPDCFVLHRVNGNMRVRHLNVGDVIRGFIDDFYEVKTITKNVSSTCCITPVQPIKKELDCFLVVDDILVSWTDLEKEKLNVIPK